MCTETSSGSAVCFANEWTTTTLAMRMAAAQATNPVLASHSKSATRNVNFLQSDRYLGLSKISFCSVGCFTYDPG